ncbi:PREDICTED: uncharacterized protein LOC105557285 [Vollenhovia emeryi]|uniref:uncharacterized protein LOC105557285 n=1 Tax=Vollenhovia emeryi TaxID=411798 RepID=UPI0005F3A5B8|nr:PREDICTED: uncharacterized protein LOC105557285 [Vollenhovia emeryi]
MGTHLQIRLTVEEGPRLIACQTHLSRDLGKGEALLDSGNSSNVLLARAQGATSRLTVGKGTRIQQIDCLSSLIIAHAHQRTLHGGTQLTLSHIRQRYWILGGRAPVKSHILRCVTCARQRGIRAHQLMGQLPLSRVTQARPFTHTGVDYAGPLTVKTWKGKGAKTTKGWICVFVCFSTSAVHLEAVSDYSTEGFIAAYRRFSSRHGIAHTLHSDCGTNFIGADTALKRLFIQSTQEHQRVSHLLSQDNTRWEFNPPATPHMGGKWEAVVKSIKFHLRHTIGEAVLTFEELTTLLTQIEAILNSRPLEPLSDDADDISALTPGHFLVGSPLPTIPEPSLTDLAISRLSRWQLIQQKAQHFWTQWSAHYLQRQQAISKWHHKNNEIKIGSLVLITDERLPPCKWPLARITALHPGKDGLVRVVTLKTATTTLIRPSGQALRPANLIIRSGIINYVADGGRNVRDSFLNLAKVDPKYVHRIYLKGFSNIPGISVKIGRTY